MIYSSKVVRKSERQSLVKVLVLRMSFVQSVNCSFISYPSGLQ